MGSVDDCLKVVYLYKYRPKKRLLLLIFILGLLVFYEFGGQHLLHLESLRSDAKHLYEYTQTHYWQMLVLTIAVYTAATALSIPGAWMRSLTTGFLFGSWVGTLIIVFSATCGAVLTFMAARYLFAEQLRLRFEKNASAARLINGFHRDAFNYLLFLRIVPMFPFWLVNIVPAFTPVEIRTFTIATSIGIAPASYALAALGQKMGPMTPSGNPLSPVMIGALMALGFLVLVPVIFRRRASTRNRPV